MAITRINRFQAGPGKGPELREFLRSVIGSILDAPGCRSCSLLCRHDDPACFVIIEVWDSVDDHEASASHIPPDLLQQAATLLGAPPEGAYYDLVAGAAGGIG